MICMWIFMFLLSLEASFKNFSIARKGDLGIGDTDTKRNASDKLTSPNMKPTFQIRERIVYQCTNTKRSRSRTRQPRTVNDARSSPQRCAYSTPSRYHFSNSQPIQSIPSTRLYFLQRLSGRPETPAQEKDAAEHRLAQLKKLAKKRDLADAEKSSGSISKGEAAASETLDQRYILALYSILN